MEQKHTNEEHMVARYVSIATVIQPMIFKSIEIKNEKLEYLNIALYTKAIPSKPDIILERGFKDIGFKIIQIDNQKIINIHHKNKYIYLLDLQTNNNTFLIHIIFILLLMLQLFLYFKIQKSLQPISQLQLKFHELKSGDITPIICNSNYIEIKQITDAYNVAIDKILYMLEIKEMFNKIFMHEIKMPIAKAMFYLKLEPSLSTNEKLYTLLKQINNELDNFAQIENLITYNDAINDGYSLAMDIIEEALKKIVLKENRTESISIELCQDFLLTGDRELWILAFKNLIDNALKYALDKRLVIKCKDNSISFVNLGDKLPIDLSQNIIQWKIEKKNRHKSSSGYGFGLFIITTSININGYTLQYKYENEYIKLSILSK